MTTISDQMAALQEQIAANEKTQLTAAQAIINACIAQLQTTFDNLPTPVGVPGAAVQFAQKTVANIQAFNTELTYLLNQYPTNEQSS